MMAEAGSLREHTVIFLHIPRSGGTTLHSILGRQYEPAVTFRIGPRGRGGVGEWQRLAAAEQAKIRLISGHMGFGLHEQVGRPSSYMTILRDPVERVISTYYFILENPKHTHHAAVAGTGMSLPAFVEQGVSKVGADNGQTRLLSGAEEMGNRVGFGDCSVELLERAKANLQGHFAVVGCTERFDETLLLLRRSFGWHWPFYVRRNATKNRLQQDEIGPEIIGLIESYNRLDRELYDYGRQLLAEQIGRQGVAFAAELGLFRLMNRLNSRRLEQQGA